MRIFQAPHRIGGPRARDTSLLAEVSDRVKLDPVSKTASGPAPVSDEHVAKLAKDLGITLRRVAGNVFENPANRDFWKVADGQIVRLVGSEVDLNESLAPADVNDPESHLASILADLEL